MLKLITEQIARDIADAIRSKKWDDETEWWSEDTIKPINFAEEILALPYEEHSPIDIDITQSPHQTITVTPTYNVEFVDGYVYFPESITLDASVVADQGYTAGTLNSTQEVVEWGDDVSFYVSEAGVYHNVIFVYDVTALGSNETMTIPFNLPDGTRMYHTFTGSGTTTLSLPEGTTFDTIMPPLSGYTTYPSSGRLQGTVSQDVEITFGYELSQYDVKIYFRDSSQHAISTTYRAYLDGNLVESGSGTSVTVTGGYGQTYRVDYDAPSGYRPSGSEQGTIPVRSVQRTVIFSIINDVSVNASPVRGDAPQTAYGTYTIIADKITSTVTAQGNDIAYGEDETINVTLPSDATGTVECNINDNIYTSDVANGKAVFVISLLPAGKYNNVLITYSGDNKYLSKTVAVNKFTVSKRPQLGA